MSIWVFDSLLVTSALMAIILLIRRPVAKAFGPGLAYALWLLPALRLLMPSIAMPDIASAVAPAGEGSQAVRDAVRESILASVPTSDAVASSAHVAASNSIDFAALGMTLWLGGAVLFFMIQMIRYTSMRDDLLSGAEELSVIDGVRVVASDQVAGPLAFGLLKRYIAVPADFTRSYSPAERDLAIAHEMAHHKSGDLYANLMAFIVLCMMWFNPLAWMSWSAFRFDQEAACDARVLAGKGPDERAIYGQALARTAFDGVPTFATALNSPKTIIKRLRRLTMKDASKNRRSLGKIGLLTAAAIILPLTATIAPSVVAQNDTTANDGNPETVKKQVRIIKIDKDGKTVNILGHDGTGGEVTKVERDGKVFVFRTDTKLSGDEVDRMVAEAEQSAQDAGDAAEEAAEARSDAEEARADAEAARAEAESERATAVAMAGIDGDYIASMIPEIDIREVTRNCKDGQPVTTNVSGFDGKNRSRVRVVMCGKGQAKLARLEALKGLKEAQQEIADDEDIPANVRDKVQKSLEQQIRKLEAQTDS
jgi:bla regulator protein blaR1